MANSKVSLKIILLFLLFGWGKVWGQNISISPTTINVGNVQVGNSANTTISYNMSNVPSGMAGYSISWSQSGSYSVFTGGMASSIMNTNPNFNQTMTFRPSSAVNYSATRTATITGANKTITMSLSGRGTAPPAPPTTATTNKVKLQMITGDK